MQSLTLHTLFLACLSATVYGQEKPEATEVWAPVPREVEVRDNNAAPSDAIVLFDGKGLSEWIGEKGAQPSWTVEDGVLTIKPGSDGLVTRRAFDDCQLHVEWRSPSTVTGEGQSRGNSGIYFQTRYEVQVLDSFHNPTYVNGQAGSVYKQTAPLVNACRPPGQWQNYDIVFRAPRFNADGTLRHPAVVTVFQNGILVQDHTVIKGPTAWIGHPPYAAHPFKQPLLLQEHGAPVSYRNIWIRELDMDATEKLLNGDTLEGWSAFLEKYGRDQDPDGNFKINNGVLHIRGKDFGYVATKKEYAEFHLKAEFKWGELQWPPRETGKRDSGILYHFPVEMPDKLWPRSIECQIQEGDCGDVWFVDTDGESQNPSEHAWGMKRVFKSGDFEKARGEWNTMEIVCLGDHFEHYVNGHLVNSGNKASVHRGRILLQSEGAEVWFRNVVLTPLE